MSKYVELLGKDLHELIYNHYDQDGFLIEDFDDVIYMAEKDIPRPKLQVMKDKLSTLDDSRNSLAKIEIAKLLASWGEIQGIEYIEEFVEGEWTQIHSEHRIFGYETILEEFERSLFNYYARRADVSESEGEKARLVVVGIIRKMISKANLVEYDMSGLIDELVFEGWNDLDDELQKYYEGITKKQENSNVESYNMKSIEDAGKNK